MFLQTYFKAIGVKIALLIKVKKEQKKITKAKWNTRLVFVIEQADMAYGFSSYCI